MLRSLEHSGRSLSLRMAVETKGAGADPNWLAFDAPEGWVLEVFALNHFQVSWKHPDGFRNR